MFAAVLLVTTLTGLCFVAGFAGGRRLLASAMAPALLVLLGVVGNHSDLVTIPWEVSIYPVFGWVFGFLLFQFLAERRSRRRAAESHEVRPGELERREPPLAR